MTGSGTQEDPYIIENVTDLQNVQNNLSAWYELGGDIDASETSGWNGGAGFVPIGIFAGHLDGKGYTISDLHINRTSDNQGLFYRCESATVTDLKLIGWSVKGKYEVGCIMAWNNTGGNSLSKIHAINCIVFGQDEVGGLFGHVANSSFIDCNFKGSIYQIYINWHGSRFGGVFGNVYGSTILRCHSNIFIMAEYASECFGGLAGDLYINNDVDQCFCRGNLYIWFYQSGGYGWRAGGFAGRIADGTDVDDCYSRVNVISSNPNRYGSRIGGFCGEHSVGSAHHIHNIYSTGRVNGSSNVGGLIGLGDGSRVWDSFWDTQTSGQGTSPGGGTGKTTAEMKTTSTFTDAGWDFEEIWDRDDEFNNGYPILQMLPKGKQVGLGGYVWVEGTKFAYLDVNGLKRLKEGTLAGGSGDSGYRWVDGDYQYYTDYLGDVRRILGTLTGLTGKLSSQISINTKAPMLGTHYCYIDDDGKERCFEGTQS